MKSEYHKAIAKHGERRWVESIPQCVLTYLIEAESTGLIKIGRCTSGVDDRLKTLRAMNADNLRLVAVIAADVEQRLHEKFADARHHNEWFRPTPELKKFIKSLSSVVYR